MDTVNNSDKSLEQLVEKLVEKKIEELAERRLNTPQQLNPITPTAPQPVAPMPAQQTPTMIKPNYPEAVPASYPSVQQTVKTPKRQKVSRSFTVPDTVFAWFSYLCGYLFCRAIHVTNSPLGSMIFVLVLFGFTGVFLLALKRKPSAPSVAAAVSAIVISLSLVVSSNAFIHTFAYIYSLTAYCYFIYTSAGKNKAAFSNMIISDWLKSTLLLPLKYCWKIEMLRATFQGKTKKSGKIILLLIIGLVAAAVPTVIVLLLLSYDQSFSNLIDKILDFDVVTVLSHIISLIYAVPIGIYIYSLYISASDNREIKLLSEENIKKHENKIRFSPVVTSVAAAIPLLAVYVIFFVSQWKYYVSGFTNVLPKDFSYAEYAREGFFQLCAVSAINLLIITCIIVFSKKSRFHSTAIKLLTCIFSVFTLVLISTAIAKMVMYIRCYGLTQKRVYATWFMIVLALIFIVVTLSRFIPKIKVAAVSAAILVIAFAGLSLCNADRLIAKYNVDKYLDGSLPSIDVAALSELGDAAVPEMVRLAKHYDQEHITDITQKIPYYQLQQALTQAQYRVDSSGFSFTFNAKQAEKALEKIGRIK